MLNKSTVIALRAALLYAGVSALWILLSDRLLALLFTDAATLSELSTYKGFFFVVVTAALLYLGLQRQFQRWEKEATRRAQVEANLLKSQNRQLFLTFLLERSEQPLGIGYADGRLGLANRAACELLGYTASELQGLNWGKDLTPREWHESERRALANLKLNGEPVRYEKEYIRKDGTRVPIELLVHAGTDEAGEQCYYAIFTDLTARKKAEQSLRESEARLSKIFQASPVGIVITRFSDGKILQANEAFARIHGTTTEKIIGRTPEEHGLWADLRQREAMVEELRSKGSCRNVEKRFRNKATGATGYLMICAETIELDGEKCMLGLARDITEQKHTADAIAQSEALYRTLFELCPDGIVLEDDQGHILDANQAYCTQTGHAREELCKLRAHDLNPANNAVDVDTNLASLLTGQTLNHFVLNRRKDGTLRLMELHEKKIQLPGGKAGILAVAKDVTERRRTEEQLRKLSRAVEQSPASIVITSRDGNIEYVNPKFCEITGYTPDEVRGKNPRVLKSGELPAAEYQRLWQTISQGQEWRGEFHNRKKNGELFWESAAISPIVDEAGRVTHYLAIKEDITERKRLEEQLRQSQKMDSIGRLAGGVAHDFNNLLSVIGGHTDLLNIFGPLNPEQKESASEVKRATERAASLTRQLLLFSRRQTLQLRDLDLNEVVTGMTKMLHRILGEDIQMQLHYAPKPLFLHADAGMLDQILLNLAVNSRDAMPRGGQLIIKTAEASFTDATAAQAPGSRPGEFVCLSVTDTGCGIAPEILPRIFEPFFTTKEIDKGTGLGLATVFGIVQQHHGWIDVASKPGHGATFSIYLPRLEKRTETKSDTQFQTAVRGGKETILLVEDDSAVRTVTRMALTRLGYKVLEAHSGQDALDNWAGRLPEIDLVLTDLVMPGGKSGLDLIRSFQQTNPQMKAIFTSGYSPEIAGKDVALRQGENFLGKPFTPRALAEIVRVNLDARPA